MASKLPPPEERFHANVIDMTGLIRSIVVNANKAGYREVTPFVVDLASTYLRDNYDKKALIEGFVRQSHPFVNPSVPEMGLDHKLWNKIHEKNEEFFKEKAFDIFKNLPVDAVSAFKKLSNYVDPKTGKSIITPSERDEIITFFYAFVKISIKYIHAIREPHVIDKDGKSRYLYKKPDFFKGVDVLEHAKKWGIELDFSRR